MEKNAIALAGIAKAIKNMIVGQLVIHLVTNLASLVQIRAIADPQAM